VNANSNTPPTRIPRNAAVLRCCQAEKRSRRESESKGRDVVETTICADEAYRKALPELVGYENIRDFIACVTYGMANDTITAFRGDRLLAGARLALSAVRQAPTDSKKRAPKSRPRSGIGASGNCQNLQLSSIKS
jgi:hypothetical protein